MATSIQDIRIPDIGGATDVTVIEVLVEEGSSVEREASLITLESDKATMEIPAPYSGVIVSIGIAVGDKVSEGDVIGKLQVDEVSPAETTDPLRQGSEPQHAGIKQNDAMKAVTAQAPFAAVAQSSVSLTDNGSAAFNARSAGPAARRLLRELGLRLSDVPATGPKGRVLKTDVIAHAKQALARGVGTAGFSVVSAPEVDFSQFGPIEIKPLSRIKRLSGGHLHRNWVTVPHVTQFSEADITEMEAYRKAHKKEAEDRGFKLTPLAFILKAVVKGLSAFPTVNTALDPSGTQLIYKHYFHIGVAIDTPQGLVVAVVRDVDKKSLFDLAEELKALGEKARSEKGLSIREMQGSCFTISSLGGIGGTAFTPIVNAPDVAILGVSRAQIKPVYCDEAFVPRLMLPLSLSYDHRVIDGAEGARFTEYLAQALADIDTFTQ